MNIEGTGAALGATVSDIDLSRPLTAQQERVLTDALGQYGVLRFPDQHLTPAQLRAFSARFGDLEVNVSGSFLEPGMPEVMTLSNIVENGTPLGLADAGQGWHTDMSYKSLVALATVLYGVEIPSRDGRSLGATEFCDMHAAYEGLPDDLKARIEGLTGLHDFNKFWDEMRARDGSKRAPLSAEQRARAQPVSHPLVMTHPITGRKVLYANPGYVVRINELPEDESSELLAALFAHQTSDEYRYVFRWTQFDLIMADNLGTIHQAAVDYGPGDRRMLKRCQVMASRYFATVGSD